MAPTLTPKRPSMQPRRSKSDAADVLTTVKRGNTQADADAEEKETPTVVFSTSPFPNKSSGKTTATNATSRSIMERAAAMAVKQPSEKLFHTQDSTSSSPGSKAEQTMATEHNGKEPAMSTQNDDDDDDDDDDDGDDASGSQEFTSTQNDESLFSEDSDNAKHLKVVSMLQNILECGLASICRLRKVFPPEFFQKMAFDTDTSVTQFHRDSIKSIVMGTSCEDDESHGSDDEDEEASMVRNIDPKTQKTLSPLTEMTQRRRKSNNADRGELVVYSDEEKKMAIEALLLMKWMQGGGVGEILRDGNLARVVFGICNNDEVIESYTFDISCMKPSDPSNVDVEEVMETAGSFFQNINGFQAGRSLSQMVPCKTQASSFSQASGAASQMSSVNYSLSQKHHTAQSQFEASQSQLMASMSQSIHATVKRNRGRVIPDTRYFSLRVDFVNSPEGLPTAFNQKKYSQLLSPVPGAGGSKGKHAAKSSKDGFVVTPLGRICESGYSGLIVDMVAETKVDGKEDEHEEESVDFTTRYSQRSANTKDHEQPFNDDDEDEDDFQPLTQPPEKDTESQLKDDDSSDSSDEEQKELWELKRVLSARKICKPNAIQCSNPSCNLVACSLWISKLNQTKWYSCMDCQEDDFEGWPEVESGELPLKTLSKELKRALIENCTNMDDPALPDAPHEEDDEDDEDGAPAQGKENVESDIQIGSTCFAKPFSKKRGQEFVVCSVLDQRITDSVLGGTKEELKVKLYSDELKTSGRQRQWLPRRRLISSGVMTNKVEKALSYRLNGKKGESLTCIVQDVAEEVNVDAQFVKGLAKKRKAALKKNSSKRAKKARA